MFDDLSSLQTNQILTPHSPGPGKTIPVIFSWFVILLFHPFVCKYNYCKGDEISRKNFSSIYLHLDFSQDADDCDFQEDYSNLDDG